MNERQAWIFIGQGSWAQRDCLLALVLWWTWPLLTRRENYDFLLFSTIWKPLRWVRWKAAAAAAKNTMEISQVILFSSEVESHEIGNYVVSIVFCQQIVFCCGLAYHAVSLVYFRFSKKCSSWPLKNGLRALRYFSKKMVLSTFPFVKSCMERKKYYPKRIWTPEII